MGSKVISSIHQSERSRAAEQLLELVPRLSRLILLEAQASDKSGLITATQFRVLRLLQKGIRLPSELARELGVTPGTASEMVDLLVRRGLVERGVRLEDRRHTPLSITSEGVAKLEAARGRALQALDDLLARLGPGELAALAVGLQALLEQMDRSAPSAAGGTDAG